MILTIKFLAVIALIGSMAWLISAPSFESGLMFIGSISALVAAFIREKHIKRHSSQHQSVSNSSTGIQAGGDVSINNIDNNKHAK